ncbi:ATP-binding protein [Nocardioides sp. YIM 152315]|uniref:ATP-binding protein n=1 Tax=Nocardioides sp. YIM 152315 TaxID=3031760 RepID=UPI0023DB7F70|nr:ATP-binding protein [Nocardioides sp. YIM 152315]MDF1605564.1 ATP-binding protein [Nocardioides sp. YIM 152315]
MGGGLGAGALPDVRMGPRAYVGLAGAVCFAVVVAASALVTHRDDFVGFGFGDLWPAGGLPIVWLMLRGARVPSIDTVLLGAAALAANLIAGADTDLAAVFAVANTVQCWVAVLLLRRWCGELWGFGGERAISRPRDVARLGAALCLATAVGTTLGSAAAAYLPGADVALEPVASGLWFGRNLASALMVVALAVLLGHRLASAPPRPSLRGADARPAELVVAILFTIATYGLAFRFDELPLAFPLLAATVWFGARFSTLLSAAHSFVVGIATALLTLGGLGPFADVADTDLGFMIAQFYVATIAVTGLAIATGRDERQALADDLRQAQEDAVYEASMRAAVIGSMVEGVLVVDEAGELLVRNAAAGRILGLGDELGSDVQFSLSSWTLDGVQLTDDERATTRALRGETVEGELVVVRVADVGERVLTISAVPLPRDEAHHRARALLLLRDTTTEHTHREELAAFAGVVAHDLRNPLAAIDGWTEMIADELDTGRLDTDLAREFVSRVRSSSRRMRELIRDLLAHATSGSRALAVSRVDVTAIVHEVASARHVGGLVSAEPVPAVHADPVLVRQVLDNLIGNAVKYVAPGEEPEIAVRGRRVDARLVAVEVVDHGIGVPAADRERIFDEFHRAHHREYEGSGLGLSIVRRIVTRHGGTIAALPNPAGQGSVFRFTLPAYDA